MNIFVLDSNIQKSAEYHCDKHVVKMILESAQLLCTTVRLNNIDYGYKITHINHPCSIWVRKSLSNFLWLKNLSYYLNEEYKYRFKHLNNHKSYDVIKLSPIPNIIDLGLTPFAQAMPEKYKCDDAVTAYRNYYIHEKKNLLKYTNRQVPNWIK